MTLLEKKYSCLKNLKSLIAVRILTPDGPMIEEKIVDPEKEEFERRKCAV